MKFIAIGELMLRLSPPNYEKLVTTHDFRVNYGGAEANVAVSLANLGVDSTFFTVLPNSDLGKSTINYLKSNDVHTKHIIRSEGRMGLYYLEEGVSVRPSQVIYDRADSAFAEYDYKDVDFEEILKDYDWLHISGITPALSYNCRKMMDMRLRQLRRWDLLSASTLIGEVLSGHLRLQEMFLASTFLMLTYLLELSLFMYTEKMEQMLKMVLQWTHLSKIWTEYLRQ